MKSSVQVDKPLIKEVKEPELTGSKIQHKGFSPDDYRQEIVQKAYDIGGKDFVAMLECENGLWDTKRKGDGGYSHGLCQIHTRWHKEPLQKGFDDWHTQLDVCYQKWSNGTVFYGPSRSIKGQKCSEYVKENRFIFS